MQNLILLFSTVQYIGDLSNKILINGLHNDIQFCTEDGQNCFDLPRNFLTIYRNLCFKRCKSQKNIASYLGLIDVRMSPSDIS